MSSDGIGPITGAVDVLQLAELGDLCLHCLLVGRGDPGLSRTYTRTAGISSGEENCADAFRTSVDSALPGNQETASFS